MHQVYMLFLVVSGVLVALGLALLALLRRDGDPRIPGRSYWQVAGVALLIGGNFVLFEHYVVLALFKKLYLFHDALTLGAIGFLVTSGLGSILVTPRTRGIFQILAALLLVPLVLFQGRLPVEATVALLAPVAFVTGSFFPALFELAWRNPLCVFAMDAVGAAAGSALAFFIPIAFGFSWFFPVGCIVFASTAFFTWRFCRIQGVQLDKNGPPS